MKKQLNSPLIYLLFAALLFVACNSGETVTEEESTADAVSTTLTISGSGSTLAVLEGLEEAFETATPGYQLQLLAGTGSGGGAEGTIAGILDAAAMSRTPKDEEAEQGIEFISMGKAATAVFTHADVGVSNLSTEQMTAIFTGEITNWSEVGGSDSSIILFVRDENDSSTSALRAAVFGDTPFVGSAKVLTSAGDMLSAVEGTPNSVGFGTWPAALAKGVAVTAIALDGVTPGEAAYPITNEMGIGFLAANQAKAQPFIDWLLSEDGQTMLHGFDLISVP